MTIQPITNYQSPRAQMRARLAVDALAHNALVWFGLVGFSFNASLELLWDRAEYPENPDPILGPHVGLNAGWSLADDIAILT